MQAVTLKCYIKGLQVREDGTGPYGQIVSPPYKKINRKRASLASNHEDQLRARFKASFHKHGEFLFNLVSITLKIRFSTKDINIER